MRKLAVFAINLIIILAVQSLFAQEDTRPSGGIPVNSPPQWVQRVQEERDRQAELLRKSNESVNPPRRTPAPITREMMERAKVEEAEKLKRLEEINKILSPPAEYYVKYAEFLKAKDTGMARLFPDRDCDKGLVVSVQDLERCRNTAQIKGAGSLYSFRLNEMPSNLPLSLILAYIGQSDIHYIGDKFVVGNEMTQDIIGDVGDINLADITLKSDSMKFLNKYKPGDTAPELVLQKQTLAKGISVNGFYYSSSASIKLNDTYVLRSIAYYNTFKTFWDTDFIAAFKVVGLEKDGSVVILWKKLKQKGAPSLRVN